MKHFELVALPKRRTFLLQRNSVRRLATGIAIFSSVAFVSGSNRALATEVPESVPLPVPLEIPEPTPSVVVTPVEGGGTVTLPVGGNGGTITAGINSGGLTLGGNTGEPLGEFGFHLAGELNSGEWRISGGLGIGGGGVTITGGTGTGGTTISIGGPIGGNGGSGTLTTGTGGTTGTLVQPIGSTGGNSIDLTLRGTLGGPNGNGVFIGIGTGLGPRE